MRKSVIFLVSGSVLSLCLFFVVPSSGLAGDIDDGIGLGDDIRFGNDLSKKVNVNYMKQKGQAKQRAGGSDSDIFGGDSPGNVNSVVVDGNVKGDIIIIDDGK